MPEFFHENRLYYNPVEFALSRIGGTWKMPILWRLREKTLRYSEIKRALPKITDKMLATQLKELEKHGLVNRTVYAEVPPRTEYSLTERGISAIGVIQQLQKYGIELMQAEGLGIEPTHK